MLPFRLRNGKIRQTAFVTPGGRNKLDIDFQPGARGVSADDLHECSTREPSCKRSAHPCRPSDSVTEGELVFEAQGHDPRSPQVALVGRQQYRRLRGDDRGGRRRRRGDDRGGRRRRRGDDRAGHDCGTVRGDGSEARSTVVDQKVGSNDRADSQPGERRAEQAGWVADAIQARLGFDRDTTGHVTGGGPGEARRSGLVRGGAGERDLDGPGGNNARHVRVRELERGLAVDDDLAHVVAHVRDGALAVDPAGVRLGHAGRCLGGGHRVVVRSADLSGRSTHGDVGRRRRRRRLHAVGVLQE